MTLKRVSFSDGYTTETAPAVTIATPPVLAEDVINTPAGNLSATDQQAANNELQSDIDLRQLSSEKGVANGYAGLDAGGKVPAGQLPAYVDDVLEYADYASLPVSGDTGIIYVTLATGKTYRWSGAAYFEISPSEVNSVNGYIGIVVLAKSDVGLSNVDNTSDVTKLAAVGTFTNKTFDADGAGNSITNIEDADIKAAAAIALSKLAATTTGKALQSNSSTGFIEPSAVTNTELGYVSGVTSAIQTQLGTKITNPMTTGGDVVYGGASGLPTRLANGSAGQVLQSAGTTLAPVWATPFVPPTITSVSSNITLANNTIYLVSTASARSLALPTPTSGTRIIIKDSTGQAATNNITITRFASEQIEGVAASKTLQTSWGSWTLVADGTNWFFV